MDFRASAVVTGATGYGQLNIGQFDIGIRQSDIGQSDIGQLDIGQLDTGKLSYVLLSNDIRLKNLASETVTYIQADFRTLHYKSQLLRVIILIHF